MCWSVGLLPLRATADQTEDHFALGRNLKMDLGLECRDLSFGSPVEAFGTL